MGLGLAFVLMTPTYYLMVWALQKSQKAFLITFAAGFLTRLTIVVLLFVLYKMQIGSGVLSFGLAFGAGYLFLNSLEIYFLKSAFSPAGSSASSAQDEEV